MTHTGPLAGQPLDYVVLRDRVSGNDGMENGQGLQNKIVIDNGKSVASVAICAALCGICMAVTIGTVWHSKQVESDMMYRERILQNHVDEMTNEVKRFKDRLEDREHASIR